MKKKTKFRLTQTLIVAISLMATSAVPVMVNSAATDSVSLVPASETQTQKLVINKLLTHPLWKKRARTQRLRLLRLNLRVSGKEGNTARTTASLAEAIIFNYSTGKASRLLVNADSGEILQEEILRGRPQPSPEEIQEAQQIIGKQAQLAELINNGSVVDGGFAVDAPQGLPRHHRYLQMRLLSANRSRLQRVVTVDLTSGKIADLKTDFR
jgi:hypothetical protein